jgi:1,4-alpha-glucan branching enzyme
LTTPTGTALDWFVDPYAREFGLGKLAAFTLGYQAHVWSSGEAGWRTPALANLVVYEINLAKLSGSSDRAIRKTDSHLHPQTWGGSRNRDHENSVKGTEISW